MVDAVDAEAESIISDIRAAFRDVPRGPLSLHQAMIAKYATADQLEEAARLDNDPHWSQIPDGDLEAGGNAFYGSDPDSWHYFMPAFMVWALRQFRVNQSFVVEQTIYALDLSSNDQLRRFTLARFALFSPSQNKVACRFLRYMAVHGDYVDDAVARHALDSHWGRYCEGDGTQ